MAEALIAKRSAKFDLGKFEDGYEVAVKELVDAKVNNLPIPKDEVPKMPSGKVINLMDALRNSLQTSESRTVNSKKGAQEVAESGMELVKASTKGKRRSA